MLFTAPPPSLSLSATLPDAVETLRRTVDREARFAWEAPESALVMTPDGRLAVSASNDGTLKVWTISGALGAGVASGLLVLPGAVLFGAIWERFGSATAFATSAVVTAVAAVLMLSLAGSGTSGSRAVP